MKRTINAVAIKHCNNYINMAKVKCCKLAATKIINKAEEEILACAMYPCESDENNTA
jgi:hypothetical protein